MAGTSDTTRTMKRRGILAAAGAVVAGIAAKQTAGPVAAVSPTTDTDFLAVGGNGFAFSCGSTYVIGLFVRGSGYGVSAASTSGIGVYGGSDSGPGVQATSHSGPGVQATSDSGRGVSASSTSGIGVYSSSNGDHAIEGNLLAPTGSAKAGVFGFGNGSGTFGVLGNGAAGIGVQGENGTIGVCGTVTGGNAIGVQGLSTNGTGVYGVTGASNQYAILGTTYATNSTAIAGTCAGNGSSAFSGGTTNPAAYAGVFQGTIVVQGRLIVSDPSYKSGALAHPDGSHRLVYCVESPESWIEDVGKGQLVNGAATVTFDKDFAAVTHTDDYHVFLTEYDGHNNLCVANRTASGFEVHAVAPGASGAFSWKVMVKAKSSVKSERLGKFTMPNLPLPDPAKFPVPQASAETKPPLAPPPRTAVTPPVTPSPSTPQSAPQTGAQPPAASPPSPGSAPNPLPAPRT